MTQTEQPALMTRPRTVRRKPDNPYPGLRAFEDHEARILFGRDRHINEILERLSEAHFVPVLGPSGCGKSSLIRAGVIPALRAGRYYDAGTRWRIAIMRPEGAPIWNLAEALYRTTINDDADNDPATIQRIASMLTNDPDGLEKFQADFGYGDDENVLILIDQFEELFKIRNDTVVRSFIETILHIHKDRFSRIHCIMTMRTDNLGDCTRFPGLAEAINKTLYLTPTLTEEELSEVVELPAIRFGARLESGLLDRILGDMTGEFDQLPLMQHVMRRIWDAVAHLPEAERVFSIRMYEEFGSIANTINHHAAELLDELDPQQKRLAELLFRQLTERREGTTHQDVRRPATFSEIVAVTENPSIQLTDDLRFIIDRFRKQDALFLRPLESEHPKIVGETSIDIVHECLIRKWDMLKDWVEQEWRSAHNLYDLTRRTADNFTSFTGTGRYKPRRQTRKVHTRFHQNGFVKAVKYTVSAFWFLIPDLFFRHQPPLDEAQVRTFDTWFKEQKPTATWAVRYGVSESMFHKAEHYLEHSKNTLQRARYRVIGLSCLLVLASVFSGWSYLHNRGKQAEQRRVAIERISSGLSISASLISQEMTDDAYSAWQRFTGDSLNLNPDEEKLVNVTDWVTSQKWLQQRIIDLDVMTGKRSVVEHILYDENKKPKGQLLGSALNPSGSAFATLWKDGIKLHAGQEDVQIWSFPQDYMIATTLSEEFPVKTGYQIAFSKDGTQIHAITDSKHIWRVDLEANTIKAIKSLDLIPEKFTFSSDGNILLIARAAGLFWIFETFNFSDETVTPLFTTGGTSNGITSGAKITSLSYQAGIKNGLAVLFNRANIAFWDMDSKKAGRRKPDRYFTSIIELDGIKLSASGEWIAASQGFSGHVWNIARAVNTQSSGQIKDIPPQASNYGKQPITKLDFIGPDELLLVRNDGETALWNYQNSFQSVRKLVNPAVQPLSLASNASGQLNIIDAPGHALDWNLRQQSRGLKYILEVGVGDENPLLTTAAISKNGKVVAVGFASGSLEIHMPILKPGPSIKLKRLALLDESVEDMAVKIIKIAVSSDGKTVAALRFDGSLVTYHREQNAADVRYIQTAGLANITNAKAISLASSGNGLVVALDRKLVFYVRSEDRTAGLWEKTGTVDLASRACTISHGHDGRKLAIGDYSGGIHIVDIAENGSANALRQIKSFGNKVATDIKFTQNGDWVLGVMREVNNASQDCPEIMTGTESHVELIAINGPDLKQVSDFQSFETTRVDFRDISFLPGLDTFILTERKKGGRPFFQFVDTEPAMRVAGTALGRGKRGKPIPTDRYFNESGARDFNPQWRGTLESMFATEIGCDLENCWMITPSFSNRHVLLFGFGAPFLAAPKE